MKINFSFASVTMCVLATNLFLIFIYFIIKKRKVLANVGYQMIGLFLILAIVRFFIPLEFESISHNINYPPLLSRIISDFQAPIFSINRTECSLWSIVEIIWLIGSIFSLFYTLRTYHNFITSLKKLANSSNIPPEYEKKCDIVCSRLGIKRNFRILILNDIQSPMICYWKGYCILMPININASPEELELIFTHEINHITHHDLLIKLGISVLNILYWWNPFCLLLKRQVNLFLEMRIDKLITNSNYQVQLSYLELLLKEQKQSTVTFPQQSVIPFFSGRKNDLYYRFSAIANSKNAPTHSLTTVFTAMALLAFILSYIFILEPHYVDPNFLLENPELIYPTSENTYFIEKPNGQYEVYINGEYYGCESSLEYYEPDIPVYKNKAELYETN